MKKVILILATLLATTLFANDGAALYKKCISCHGVQAEKKALGKSQVIATWSSQKIVDALHGYKDGTYGGAQKGLMKSQVSKLGDKEIEALSHYIDSLM